MPQKVIEIVGASKESFAKAAENAVTEAAKTVRGVTSGEFSGAARKLNGFQV
jgi:flavin-binding protein dodecin